MSRIPDHRYFVDVADAVLHDAGMDECSPSHDLTRVAAAPIAISGS